MVRGNVKWFNEKKGFGFITVPDGKDIFVHYSNIMDEEDPASLSEGETVEFELEEGPKGPKAVKVRRLFQRLKVNVWVDDLVPEDDAVDSLFQLFLALNAYHVASGGQGLTIDDWQTFLSVPDEAEVL